MTAPATPPQGLGSPLTRNAPGFSVDAIYSKNDGNVYVLINGMETQIFPSAGGTLQVNVGAFTKNLADASVIQNVITVGFQPKALLVFCAAASGTGPFFSLGITDGTTTVVTVQDPASLGNFEGEPFLAWLRESGVNSQLGAFNGFLVNGFSISWTKIGLPTSSVDVFFLAIG